MCNLINTHTQHTHTNKKNPKSYIILVGFPYDMMRTLALGAHCKNSNDNCPETSLYNVAGGRKERNAPVSKHY